MKRLLATLTLSATLLAPAAWAQHFDIELAEDGSKVIVTSPAPTDFATGNLIFEGDFGDLAGGPYSTDDPGFAADDGMLPGDEIVSFQAVGSLQYWDGFSWTTAAPNGERVSIEDAFGNTISWTDSGIVGNLTGPIDMTDSEGGLHSHLDFSISSLLGTPTISAYMIEMALLTDTLGLSDNIFIAFNLGLDHEAFEAAIGAREVPLPGAALLFMSSLAGLMIQRRRNA